MKATVHQAVLDHNLDTLARLLMAGGDPNELHEMCTPIHDALEDVEAVALLLRYGADPNSWTIDRGATPLLTAFFFKQYDAALMLLAAGADPNVRSNEGEVPISMCVEEGNLKMAATLLRAGAAKSIEESTVPTGRNAFGHAAHRLDIEMIKLLLSWGASLTNRDVDRRTPRDCLPPRSEENAQTWDQAFELLSPQS